MLQKNEKPIFLMKIVTFIILLTVSINAQSQKLKTFYITENGERSSKNFATYKRSVIEKDNKWIVKDYYLNDCIQMTGFYLDKKLKQKTDTFTFYYLNGNISRIAVYKNEKKHGETKSYLITGKLSKTAHYNMGTPNGKWIWYDETGSIENEIVDADKNKIQSFNRMPSYNGGIEALRRYVNKVEYPIEAQINGTYGQTITLFQINEKGIVNDVDIIVHGTLQIDSAIIKHIYKMAPWQPALKNGKAVSARFYLPIQFALNSNRIKVSNKIIGKGYFKSGVEDYKLKNYEDAVYKFKQATRYNKMEAQYYYYLGMSNYKLNKKEVACEYWKITNILDDQMVKQEIKNICNFEKKAK